MKNLIYCSILLAAIGCGSPAKETLNMPGTYLMTSQTVNNGKTETKVASLKQLKIYTDSFWMYTQVNPADSVSAFGVGSYNVDSGMVIENEIFSARDTAFNLTAPSYKLNITKTQDGYEQVIPEITIASQKSRLTEVYQTVGTTAKSPLDGMWKEISSYIIKGKDTTNNTRTQYKSFYAGWFMFGSSNKDSSSKYHTVIGFGTFKMNGDTKMEETDLNATYKIAAGRSFDIDIEMTGADNYKQTITQPDGSKSVENYGRLKK